MIEYKKLTIEDIKLLKRLVPNDHPTELLKFQINSNCEKIFLYPTNDVYILEHQFNVLRKIVSTNSRINIVQSGNFNLYRPGNIVNILSAPLDFKEYMSIYLDSITMIYSDKFEWILITDEERYWGWGVFCSNKRITDEFKSHYSDYKNDIERYVQTHASLPDLTKTMMEFLDSSI